MSRIKGSLNKATLAKIEAAKNKGGVFNIKMQKQIEGSPITRKNGAGFVNWGYKNNMPNLLLDLYNQSPTHRACINFGVQSIVGDGISYEDSKFDGKEIVPNAYEDWNSLIRKISLDFMLYGSYSIECILNKDGKTLSYYHIPLDRVRWSDYDEDGQITSYWIANDWTEIGKNPPIKIDAFDMRPDTKIEKGHPYLYVYRPYDPCLTYYTTPHYQACIKSVQAEIEYQNFDIRSASNSFVPSGMLLLNSVEDDRERQAVIDNVQKMFVGTDNAAQIMVSFRNNIEEQAPTFVPFTANQGNVNLFDSANQRIVNRILAGHQINDPHLVGLPQYGAVGFNSEAAMLETSYNVYLKVVGNYNRQCVIQTFNSMLSLNGVDTEIVMKPLRFNDIQPNAVSSTTKGVGDVNANDYNENKIEEKKDGSENAKNN